MLSKQEWWRYVGFILPMTLAGYLAYHADQSSAGNFFKDQVMWEGKRHGQEIIQAGETVLLSSKYIGLNVLWVFLSAKAHRLKSNKAAK